MTVFVGKGHLADGFTSGIDQEPLNPWLIEVDLEAIAAPSRVVKMHIGLAVLIFELQQSGVQVTESTILDFVNRILEIINQLH